MKDERHDEEKPTPSPYQDTDADVEVTEVYYQSPAQGKMVFLGKMIRKITPEGKITYTLLDPGDRIMGEPLDNVEDTKKIWASIAELMENRAIELKQRRNDTEQDKGKER